MTTSLAGRPLRQPFPSPTSAIMPSSVHVAGLPRVNRAAYRGQSHCAQRSQNHASAVLGRPDCARGDFATGGQMYLPHRLVGARPETPQPLVVVCSPGLPRAIAGLRVGSAPSHLGTRWQTSPAHTPGVAASVRQRMPLSRRRKPASAPLGSRPIGPNDVPRAPRRGEQPPRCTSINKPTAVAQTPGDGGQRERRTVSNEKRSNLVFW